MRFLCFVLGEEPAAPAATAMIELIEQLSTATTALEAAKEKLHVAGEYQ